MLALTNDTLSASNTKFPALTNFRFPPSVEMVGPVRSCAMTEQLPMSTAIVIRKRPKLLILEQILSTAVAVG